MIFIIPIILISYLIGAIPFGYLLTKYFLNVNILEVGSGNIGSTNVKRIAGRKISIYSQLLDMAKGLIVVAIAIILQHYYPQFPYLEYVVYLVAIAVILGHNFSIFSKFKGGKGVNTTLGASLLIAPIPVLSAVVFYYLVKWMFKYVSLGSLAIAIVLPLGAFFQFGTGITSYYFLICSTMIILRHTPNIKRLLEGKEFKS
jgi:glycerol-3-phosphate acyltransferase PlsY